MEELAHFLYKTGNPAWIRFPVLLLGFLRNTTRLHGVFTFRTQRKNDGDIVRGHAPLESRLVYTPFHKNERQIETIKANICDWPKMNTKYNAQCCHERRPSLQIKQHNTACHATSTTAIQQPPQRPGSGHPIVYNTPQNTLRDSASTNITVTRTQTQTSSVIFEQDLAGPAMNR